MDERLRTYSSDDARGDGGGGGTAFYHDSSSGASRSRQKEMAEGRAKAFEVMTTE